ncbi:MAG: polyprenyl synthetase family protein, partial [Candidatus Omnitrophica bacterium]|nr:polyprenyl synthetase family protein [Candidatus Omnitrophota bacterium]
MNPILSQSTVSQFAPLQTIYAPVWDALERVDQEYLRQIEGERGMIQEIGRHLAEGRGKFLRPALVLLSAAHSGGADDALRVKLGVVVELIHVASLIHDDVMDHAALRRKQVTLNSRWGDEASVICGDILYSKAFKLLVDIGVPDVMQTVARSTMVMCSGQLAELERRQDLGLQREGYLDIIIQKTARLISDCCRSGAQLAGAHPSV